MTAPVQAQTQPLTAENTAAAAAAATAAAAAASAQLAYDLQQAALRAQMVAALMVMWQRLGAGGILNHVPADRFVEEFLPIVKGAQRSMSALTVAAIRQDIRNAGVRPSATPIRTERYVTERLRGVDPRVVYRRPITEVRYALSRGVPMEQALARGARRAESISVSDLQLAKTHTARDTMAAEPKVVGYRRVLSNRGNHCALCVLASTQRYRREDLAAMHPGCGCSVRPIVGDRDPGRVLNADRVVDITEIIRRDLGERYASASGIGAAGISYRNIIVVNNHGELGPVLGVRDHAFTGPDGIARFDPDVVALTPSDGRPATVPQAI